MGPEVERFSGFSLPEGTYFPPELNALLPYIETMSELKVLLAVLHAYFQAGLDARPLKIDELMERTGLSRYGVNEGLKRGRQRGTIRRLSRRGRYAYEPSLKIRLPHEHDHGSHGSYHEESSHETHEDHEESELRTRIYEVLMTEFEVAQRIASNIAFHRLDVGMVWRQIEQARSDVAGGFRPKNPAGFVVSLIRDLDEDPGQYRLAQFGPKTRGEF